MKQGGKERRERKCKSSEFIENTFDDTVRENSRCGKWIFRNSSACGFPVTESVHSKSPAARGDSVLVKFTHSHGPCSKCKVLG